MAVTASVFATTATAAAGTWTGITNAQGTNNNVRATWTSAVSSASAQALLSGWDLSGLIAQGDTITSVSATVWNFLSGTNATTNVTSITAQLIYGAANTNIGTAVTLTRTATTTNAQTITFLTAPTYAQLHDLKVRITVARGANTVSSTFNLDAVSLALNYTDQTMPARGVGVAQLVQPPMISGKSTLSPGVATATLKVAPTAGNLLIFIASHFKDGSTVLTGPTGATVFAASNNGLCGLTIWTRVVQSGDPRAWTMSSNSDLYSLEVMEFSSGGAGTTPSISNTPTFSAPAAGLSIKAPDATPTTINSFALTAVALDSWMASPAPTSTSPFTLLAYSIGWYHGHVTTQRPALTTTATVVGDTVGYNTTGAGTANGLALATTLIVKPATGIDRSRVLTETLTMTSSLGLLKTNGTADFAGQAELGSMTDSVTGLSRQPSAFTSSVSETTLLGPLNLTLSGSGTTTTTLSSTTTSAPSLSGTGTLTATVAASATRAVSPTGTGALTATVASAQTVTAAPSGTGTVSGSTSALSVTMSAAVSGSGTVDDTVAPAATRAVAPAGTGGLAATLTGLTGTIAPTGDGLGTVSTTVSSTGARDADAAGSGTVGAALAPALVASPVASGSGTLSATLSTATTITAALTASGNLGVATDAALPGILTGSGTLTGTVVPSVTKPVDTSGTGTLTSTIQPNPTFPGAVSGSGQLTATLVPTLNADLSGTGTLTDTVQPFATFPLTPNGVGTLTAVITPAAAVNAVLTGVGTVTASTSSQPTVVAGPNGSGTLTASVTAPTLVVNATPSGTGTTTTVVASSIVVAAAPAGTGTTTAGVAPAQTFTATPAGTGTVSATVTPGATYSGTVGGVGTLVGVSARDLAVAANLTAVGNITGTAGNRTVTIAPFPSGQGTLAAVIIRHAAVRHIVAMEATIGGDFAVVELGDVSFRA